MKNEHRPVGARLINVLQSVEQSTIRDNENVTDLLRDIRDELRRNNDAMQVMRATAGASAPVEPVFLS
jgi:hypothetical protein